MAFKHACKLGCAGHRVKAARLALSLGALGALGEGQKPASTGVSEKLTGLGPVSRNHTGPKLTATRLGGQ